MSLAPSYFIRRLPVILPLVLFLAVPCSAEGPASFERTDYLVGGKPTKTVVADLNLDDNLDVLVLVGGSVRVLYGQGAGAFAKRKILPGGSYPSNLASADFNLDSLPDIAVLCFTNLRFLTGTPEGKFKRLLGPRFPFPWFGMSVGDLDLDTVPDIAALQHVIRASRGYRFDDLGYYLNVFTGVGDGTFTRTQHIHFDAALQAVCQADFDDDGLPDLALSTAAGDGSLALLYGQVGGGYSAPAYYAAPPSYEMICAELDSDGLTDIALTNWQTNALAVLYCQVGGAFGAAETYTVQYPRALAAGDFNADGLNDIAVTRGLWGKDGLLTILYGQESGGFAQPTDYPVGRTPLGVAVADFNADGRPDLAVSNGTSHTVSVLLNAGIAP